MWRYPEKSEEILQQRLLGSPQINDSADENQNYKNLSVANLP